MFMSKIRMLMASLGICALLAGGGVALKSLDAAEKDPAREPSAAPGGRTVFNEYSFWRCRFSHAPMVARMKDGLWPSKDFRIDGPAEGWTQPGFDDSGWAWAPGPFFNSRFRAGFIKNENTSGGLALICLRKAFRVADPAAAGDVRVNLHFRGGAVVYVNGKELARSHLPEGKVDYSTLAEDYPKEAFVKPDGHIIRWAFKDPTKYKCYETRTRRIGGLKIPPEVLKKGLNVLAIEIHRAPIHQAAMGKLRKGGWRFFGHKTGYPGRLIWTTVGMPRVRLTATGCGVSDPAQEKGLSVWTVDPAFCIFQTDLGPGQGKPKPVRIAGTRGGKFAGQVVLASSEPIKGLKAVASELKAVGSGGGIAAGNVRVFYSAASLTGKQVYLRVPNGHPFYTRIKCFDALQEKPPSVAGLARVKGCKPLALRAIQPVWIRVEVPPNAAAGKYQGRLTVEAEGQKKIEVPVEVSVADWKLPPAHEWRTFADFYQSPEAVAMKYKVPMWSDEHFRLLERALRLLGSIGNKSLYISCIAKTDVGNSGTMLRWKKNGPSAGPGQTGYEPDFTVVDRYLALARKYLVKPRVVCLYVWDRPFNGGYFGAKAKKVAPPEVSVVDAKGGKGTLVAAPLYDDAHAEEAEKFWKPAAEGILKRMKDLGWSDSLMLGIGDDVIPAPSVCKLWQRLLPRACWVSMAHPARSNFHKVFPVGYATTVWDAKFSRSHGWRRKDLVCHFDRDSWRSPLQRQLLALGYLAGERNINGKQRGFGRLSADLTWMVIKTSHPRRPWRSISGRYPGNKGQLSIRMNPYLAPGPAGHVSTARFEMMREGLQECEARIFIEDALLDKAKAARLGAELSARCKRMFNERRRDIGYASGLDGALSFVGAGRIKRNAELFALAGEVAAKLRLTAMSVSGRVSPTRSSP